MTKFMSDHGFKVQKSFHLETAWLATYQSGEGGRIIGVNSEASFHFISLINKV